MTEPFQLKPIGSMFMRSELTDTTYHVTKFYSRVRREGKGFVFIGHEAVEKHPLGECKHCR